MLITLTPFDNILLANYPQNRHELFFCVYKSLVYPQKFKIIHTFINNLMNLLKYTKYKAAVNFYFPHLYFFSPILLFCRNKLSTAVDNFVDNLLRCL